MVSRKRGLIAAGLVLLLIGGYFIYDHNPANTYQSTFNVLPNRYFKILANLRDATHITGTFTENNGRPVDFMIMSSAQFAAFQVSSGTANLYSLPTTPRGDVDWTSSIPDAYYLVFRHGPAFLNTTQTVTFVRTYTSLDEVALVAGIGLIVLAVIELYWGFRPAGRKTASAGGSPSTDIPPPPWP